MKVFCNLKFLLITVLFSFILGGWGQETGSEDSMARQIDSLTRVNQELADSLGKIRFFLDWEEKMSKIYLLTLAHGETLFQMGPDKWNRLCEMTIEKYQYQAGEWMVRAAEKEQKIQFLTRQRDSLCALLEKCDLTFRRDLSVWGDWGRETGPEDSTAQQINFLKRINQELLDSLENFCFFLDWEWEAVNKSCLVGVAHQESLLQLELNERDSIYRVATADYQYQTGKWMVQVAEKEQKIQFLAQQIDSLCALLEKCDPTFRRANFLKPPFQRNK